MYAQIPALIGEAVQHFQQGSLDEASSVLEQVLRIQPRSSEALHILGVVRALQGAQIEAIELFKKALPFDKRNSFLHFNLAKALSETGQETEALVHHRQATKLAPAHQEAWLNYGKSLASLGRHEEALTALDQALLVHPRYAEAQNNKGLILAELGQPKAAIACFDQAIAVHPDFKDAHWNRSIELLKLGRYDDAWSGFEFRWQMDARDTPRLTTTRPLWNGEASNQPLLLWGEQGLGDQILYASILPELSSLPQKKILAVDKRLIDLFHRSLPDFDLVDLKQTSDALHFGAHLPLGSLPRYFRPSIEAFAAAHHPYLSADIGRAAELRGKIAIPGKLICGISWSSNRRDIGLLKSIGLAQMLMPLASSGLHFVNLQYGNTAAERDALQSQHGITMQNVEEIDNFNDIDGLAALIEACDLVITTSNTTAHLAGALGKETLLLLPLGKGQLWYWMGHEGQNPWYPSIHVFAQEQAGQWDAPMVRLRTYIENESWK